MLANLHTMIFAAVNRSGCHEPEFFGLKPWYHYLVTTNQCEVVNFGGSHGDDITAVGNNLALIALAIVDDLLRIAGLVAIGFIIYGGILYITSQGSPEQTGKAQNTVQNALVGLVIAILAVSMVSFLGNKLAG